MSLGKATFIRAASFEENNKKSKEISIKKIKKFQLVVVEILFSSVELLLFFQSRLPKKNQKCRFFFGSK